jgi:hypothetical protein
MAPLTELPLRHLTILNRAWLFVELAIVAT